MPARIRNIQETGKTFCRPQKFSLEQRLRDSFGVYSGKGEFEVVIRFNARVADYIREKKWHDSQQVRDLKKGGLELRLTLSSLAEVERWVLGWAGSRAKDSAIVSLEFGFLQGGWGALMAYRVWSTPAKELKNTPCFTRFTLQASYSCLFWRYRRFFALFPLRFPAIADNQCALWLKH